MSEGVNDALAEIFANYYEAQAKRRRESELLGIAIHALIMKAELDAEAVRVQNLIRCSGALGALNAQHWSFPAQNSSRPADGTDKR